jgi:hypothetical protein
MDLTGNNLVNVTQKDDVFTININAASIKEFLILINMNSRTTKEIQKNYYSSSNDDSSIPIYTLFKTLTILEYNSIINSLIGHISDPIVATNLTTAVSERKLNDESIRIYFSDADHDIISLKLNPTLKNTVTSNLKNKDEDVFSDISIQDKNITKASTSPMAT